jgi:NAD(P)-dependent dehydrogenase (short-subunit alcohol dehydrogenase family)
MNPLQIVFLRLRITDNIAAIIIHISSPMIDAGPIAQEEYNKSKAAILARM